MAVSLPMQERNSAAMQAGTRSLTKPFSPLRPSRVAIVVIDLYLLCCVRATGAGENNVHAQKLQWNKVKNGAIMPFAPPRSDTVITVHLEEKLHHSTLTSTDLCCSVCSRSYYVIMCCHLCPRCTHLSLLLLFQLLISCWSKQAGACWGHLGVEGQCYHWLPPPGATSTFFLFKYRQKPFVEKRNTCTKL